MSGTVRPARPEPGLLGDVLGLRPVADESTDEGRQPARVGQDVVEGVGRCAGCGSHGAEPVAAVARACASILRKVRLPRQGASRPPGDSPAPGIPQEPARNLRPRVCEDGAMAKRIDWYYHRKG